MNHLPNLHTARREKKKRVIFVTRSQHPSLVTVKEQDSEPVWVGSSDSVPPMTTITINSH